MSDCLHDWVVSDGHRAKYWCRLCPATGFRKVGQWAGKIYAHARPRDEYRPKEAASALPMKQAQFESHQTIPGYGRVYPKPRAK